MNKLPEIKRFIKEAAANYPDLTVKYVGGDPRIKFIVSPDGAPLHIDPEKHYQDSVRGIGTEHIVNIVNMNFEQVKQLLKSKGVKTRSELAVLSSSNHSEPLESVGKALSHVPPSVPSLGPVRDTTVPTSVATEDAVEATATLPLEPVRHTEPSPGVSALRLAPAALALVLLFALLRARFPSIRARLRWCVRHLRKT